MFFRPFPHGKTMRKNKLYHLKHVNYFCIKTVGGKNFWWKSKINVNKKVIKNKQKIWIGSGEVKMDAATGNVENKNRKL